MIAFLRLAAFLIDYVVLLSFYMVLSLVFDINRFKLPIFGLWWFGSLFLVLWLYHAILESSPWQGTVGKKLLNLKVANLKGERIGFLRASSRYFLLGLSRLLCGLGFLLIFFTKRKQTLHDKLSNTVVHR